MGRELGRISGPLLADNLLRNGSNLAFDTQVLYLDVVNGRVGFNTLAPTVELTVPNQANTINLVVDTQANFGNFTVTTNNIQHVTGGITIQPDQSSNPTVVTPGLSTAKLYFSGNTLLDTVTNDNININPVGTGQIKLNNNVLISGGLHTTGNITFDGNIQLGNETTDRITFVAEVTSNILPAPATTASKLLTQSGPLFIGIDDEFLLLNKQYLYNLGSPSLQWNTLYASSLISPGANAVTITTSSTTAGGITFGSNTINSTSTDIVLSTSGTGQVKLNGVPWISGNSIQNTTNSGINIFGTNNGYVKFTGKNGLVLPVGNSNNRPKSPQQGAMRYNTDLGYAEIYSGTNWSTVGGSGAVLTQGQVNDAMWAWDLILG